MKENVFFFSSSPSSSSSSCLADICLTYLQISVSDRQLEWKKKKSATLASNLILMNAREEREREMETFTSQVKPVEFVPCRYEKSAVQHVCDV